MVEIRGAADSDAAAIVEIMNPIIERGTFSAIGEPLDARVAQDWIQNVRERGVFHVAEGGGGELIGIQTLEPFSPWPAFAHVGDIGTFVRMDFHRKGVGAALLEATLRQARALGLRKVMATIRGDNPLAIGFYESQGFQRIGVARKHACIRGQYVDEVFMDYVFPD